MKYQLLLIISLSSALAFGQNPGETTTKSTTRIMKGSELNRILGDMKVTDENYYDVEGNILDPADVKAKLMSFDYEPSIRKLKQFPDYKHVISKVDKKIQAEMDSIYSFTLQPTSAKLKTGTILDTKPLYSYVDKKRLDGKIIALIFWSDAYYAKTAIDVNEKLNNVLNEYKIPGKIEILAITHHPAGRAAQALLRNPIINTQHILDAQDLTKAYGTENDLVMLLTDPNHKILYAVRGSAAMTPRQFDKYLKRMLN